MLYSFLSIYIPFKGIYIISYRNVYNQNLTLFPFNIHITNNSFIGINSRGFQISLFTYGSVIIHHLS